jgi:hypothetical protein
VGSTTVWGVKFSGGYEGGNAEIRDMKFFVKRKS